jgi:hypothetical protein
LTAVFLWMQRQQIIAGLLNKIRSIDLIQRKMSGEKDLQKLLKTMKPEHNGGDYVFCKVNQLGNLNLDEIEMIFREKEAITLILKKETAEKLNLEYSLVMSWITLSVHSSLEAVGLTAAFSKALSENGISCNVVAAFYHDHIFVGRKDVEKTMEILNAFSR